MTNPILFLEKNKEVYEIDIFGKDGDLAVIIVKQNNRKIQATFLDKKGEVWTNDENAPFFFEKDIVFMAFEIGHFLYETHTN